MTQFTRLALNETRWRGALAGFEVSRVHGLQVIPMHPNDLNALMLETFTTNFSYDDTGVFLLPAEEVDQKLMLEVDFGYETTRKVEELLRSGKIQVEPCEGRHQYWYTVKVLRGEGSGLLEDIIAPSEYHARWNLRGNIQIQISDGDITIMGRHSQACDPAKELSTILFRRYGVPIATKGLRQQAGRMMEQALQLEKRAAYFEGLNEIGKNKHPGAQGPADV